MLRFMEGIILIGSRACYQIESGLYPAFLYIITFFLQNYEVTFSSIILYLLAMVNNL